MGYIALYLLAIVGANLVAAHFGAWVTPITAFVFIGLDITTRDALHESWKGKQLWFKMAALVLVGSGISYLLNHDAARIAIASTAAFALGGVVDTTIYHVLRKRTWFQKVNASNVGAATVDSIAFPTLAFGAFLPWVILGQLAAKVVGGYLWSLVIGRRQHG